MQLSYFKKQIGLTILFGLLFSIMAPSAFAVAGLEDIATNIEHSIKNLDLKKAVGLAAILLVLAAVVHYKTKKTTPRPLVANDDSWQEQLRVFWYNYIVGQKAKEERPAALVQDADNPNQLLFKYEKIEAFGLCGLAETYGPNILTALLIISTLLKIKDELHKGMGDWHDFWHDPLILLRPSPSTK